MWIASDPSGILQVRIPHIIWFITFTLHVLLKLLVDIALTHQVFPFVKFTEKNIFFPKTSIGTLVTHVR